MEQKPDLFDDEDASVEDAPLRGTPEEDGSHFVDDLATGMAIRDSHVLVHEPNPDGVFSPSNPRFEGAGCVPLEGVL